MSDEAITLLRSIVDRLDRIEQRTAPVVTTVAATMTQREAMKLLGYSDRESFWVAIRRLGIPYSKLSERRALFRREDIDAVLKQRQVGTRKVRAA